jgi:hypothetical protein
LADNSKPGTRSTLYLGAPCWALLYSTAAAMDRTPSWVVQQLVSKYAPVLLQRFERAIANKGVESEA